MPHKKALLLQLVSLLPSVDKLSENTPGVGLDDPFWSLPTRDIQRFCDSHLISAGCPPTPAIPGDQPWLRLLLGAIGVRPTRQIPGRSG